MLQHSIYGSPGHLQLCHQNQRHQSPGQHLSPRQSPSPVSNTVPSAVQSSVGERVQIAAAASAPTNSHSKVCKGCHRLRPLSAYQAHPETFDKLSAKCKACHHAYQLAYARANRDRVNQRQRLTARRRRTDARIAAGMMALERIYILGTHGGLV